MLLGAKAGCQRPNMSRCHSEVWNLYPTSTTFTGVLYCLFAVALYITSKCMGWWYKLLCVTTVTQGLGATFIGQWSWLYYTAGYMNHTSIWLTGCCLKM